MTRLARKFLIVFFLCGGISTSFAHDDQSQKYPKNVIFIIADGMGFNYVELTRIFNGNQKLSFEKFPYQASVTTCSAEGALADGSCDKNSSKVTDSAAAATAIATGHKVSNAVVGLQIPGNGQRLVTMLERAKLQGKSTGLVTTKLITDATPACFGAHTVHRDNEIDILRDYLSFSTPNILFGADLPHYKTEASQALIGYKVISTIKDLHKLRANSVKFSHIFGGFGQHELIPGNFTLKSGLPLEITGEAFFTMHQLPHLSDMGSAAIDILSKNKKGFFLMIESAQTDMIGHTNRMFPKGPKLPTAAQALIAEMMELHRMVEIAQAYAQKHNDTLVIVTADHETGGLQILKEETTCLGQKDCIAEVQWNSPKYPGDNEEMVQHTNIDVPVYAFGTNAELFSKAMNNTEFMAKIFGSPTPTA